MSAGIKVPLTLRVNGEEFEVVALVHHTLLEVLREELDLTGTKHGCELGECGACAVLLDGEPQISCLMLAVEAQGHEITTVEGLARGSEPRWRSTAARSSDASANTRSSSFSDLMRCRSCQRQSFHSASVVPA